MILTIATILATLAGVATDTTFVVRPGSRLEVHNFGGAIAITVWDKNSVRIAADHSDAIRVAIQRTGEVIEVNSRARRAIPRQVDFRIVVPKWMALDLSGVYTDVDVNGSHADVSAETVHGNVNVNGGFGVVRLSSLQGSVTVGGAKGRVELTALNDDVNISDVEGDIWVDAVNGDVKLDRVNARTIEVSTVNGDIAFLGPILEGGRYRLASHQGDLILGLPLKSDAKVTVATFSGDFESDFPVEVGKGKQRGRRFAFTLGNGSALVDLETFAGTVRLHRELRDVERAMRTLRAVDRDLRTKERAIRKARAPHAPNDPNRDQD